MSKKKEEDVYRDPSKASNKNPKGYDYDRDRTVDAYDDALAVKDFNQDGTITPAEEREYNKKVGTVTQTSKVDEQGNVIESKTETFVQDVPAPQPWMDELTKEFLKRHPGIAKALKLARDNNWDQERFNRYIETQTTFGKTRTDAQAAFDLAIAGAKSEDIENQITAKAKTITQQAKTLLGENFLLDQAAVSAFARKAVRDGLTDDDVRIWVASQYKPQMATQQPQTLEGTAFSIEDSLKQMARSYGLPINDQFISQKLQEGLKQKDWASWLEGQRGVFRQQAKTLYPTVSNLLDSSTLEDVMTPYRNAAFNLLGIPIEQQHLDDPMWNEALRGANGPMSLDQWMVKLKSDPKYGFDKTTTARREYANLADELLSAFGMA